MWERLSNNNADTPFRQFIILYFIPMLYIWYTIYKTCIRYICGMILRIEIMLDHAEWGNGKLIDFNCPNCILPPIDRPNKSIKSRPPITIESQWNRNMAAVLVVVSDHWKIGAYDSMVLKSIFGREDEWIARTSNQWRSWCTHAVWCTFALSEYDRLRPSSAAYTITWRARSIFVEINQNHQLYA